MIYYKVKVRLLRNLGTDDFSLEEIEKVFTNKSSPIEARKEAFNHYESYFDVFQADISDNNSIVPRLYKPFIDRYKDSDDLPTEFPENIGISILFFSDNEELLTKGEDYFIFGSPDYFDYIIENLELEKKIYDINNWDTQNWIRTIKYYDTSKHSLETIYVEDPNAVIFSEVLWTPTDFWSSSNPAQWAEDDKPIEGAEKIEKEIARAREVKDSLLLKVIKQGENQKLEFKSTLSYCLRHKSKKPYVELEILKTIAAFANTNGGTLLVGVADNGKVLGLKNDFTIYKNNPRDKFLKHFANVIKKGFTEPIDAIIKYEFDASLGKEIFLVMVEKSTKPRFLNSKGEDKEFYIRRSATSQKLNVEEAVKYSIDKWHTLD
ncbi:MAG: hypothetical protein CL526_02870 [Aequorivita sp.]|nr:hypothetical protein [Aequorivita sp.]|tara:strand:- start:22372 stop:23502 length:1131 start_codon:yes stop_codon:yes gene_type:complete